MLSKPLLIGICGGTCSGKSYLSNIIRKYYQAEYINQDNYFKDLSLCENRVETIKNTNFDCPDAYDIDLFISHLKQLLKVVANIYKFFKSLPSWCNFLKGWNGTPIGLKNLKVILGVSVILV